jgi:hypothetical protein
VQLYTPLKLTPPVVKPKQATDKQAAGATVDEHASYASLVDTAGY